MLCHTQLLSGASLFRFGWPWARRYSRTGDSASILDSAFARIAWISRFGPWQRWAVLANQERSDRLTDSRFIQANLTRLELHNVRLTAGWGTRSLKVKTPLHSAALERSAGAIEGRLVILLARQSCLSSPRKKLSKRMHSDGAPGGLLWTAHPRL